MLYKDAENRFMTKKELVSILIELVNALQVGQHKTERKNDVVSILIVLVDALQDSWQPISL